MGEGRIENLRPWAKGTSGNPGGRPRRDVLTEALKAQLASDDSDGRTFAEQIAAVRIKHALRGDVRAIREIADRTEGRPRQQFNIDASATFFGGLVPNLSGSPMDLGEPAKPRHLTCT